MSYLWYIGLPSGFCSGLHQSQPSHLFACKTVFEGMVAKSGIFWVEVEVKVEMQAVFWNWGCWRDIGGRRQSWVLENCHTVAHSAMPNAAHAQCNLYSVITWIKKTAPETTFQIAILREGRCLRIMTLQLYIFAACFGHAHNR